MTDVGQNWRHVVASEGMLRTLSVDTATMMMEGDLQQDAVCQSICKDMMFMGQCDSSGIYYPESSIGRSPVVVVYREEEALETIRTQSTAITPNSRKRSIRFRRSKSQQSSRSSRRGSDPENVDVVYMVEDKQQNFIEVCLSPLSKVDDLCVEQGWPRS
jgi:hypothetical protein